jgi:hypothetical protein
MAPSCVRKQVFEGSLQEEEEAPHLKKAKTDAEHADD